MKVLLVSADNIYLTPYIKIYLKICRQKKIEYEVIYWDKNVNEQYDDDLFHRFVVKNSSPFYKIIGYINFVRRVRKIIKSKQISFIIGLHPICNILLFPLLITKFRQKFIFDVRDYSYEKFFLVRKIEEKLVKYSSLNIISSEGYKAFLPNGKYLIAHNIPSIEPENSDNKKLHKPIRLSYIGLIRFMDQNKKIIDFFRNDSRFQIQFIGTNANQLRDYCKEKEVDNVVLIDTFPDSKSKDYFSQSDIILNLYGNNTPLLDYALSNKLYYAALLRKPILVCENTYMEKVSHKFGFGFTIRMKDSSELDDLYNYYNSLDRKRLRHDCDIFLAQIFRQQQQYLSQVENVLTN